MKKKNSFFLKGIILSAAVLLMSGCAAARPDYTLERPDMKFAYVKGGTFQMGSNNSLDEQPVRAVTVGDLFVGMYEVTFSQYEKFCTTAARCELPHDQSWGQGDRPVINVTWNDANDYAAWLSRQTGMEIRLPSEAEWEYFSRAGTTTKYWTGDAFPKGAANCEDCGTEWHDKTSPVGSFPPNPWKLYDIAGNVQEWVLDDYQGSYDGAPVDGTAVITEQPGDKCVRGGAWGYPMSDMRSSSRDFRPAKMSSALVGFRLVLVPNSKTPVLGSK